MSDVIAERVLELRQGDTSTPVVVRIHRPERQPTGVWDCVLEIDGPRVFRRMYHGADSAEALFCALRVAQNELEGYTDQLKWRGAKPWIEIAPLV